MRARCRSRSSSDSSKRGLVNSQGEHPVRAHMKTQYYTAASLDGFIATPDDSLEWLFPLGDIADTGYPAFIEHVGALAMGAATYGWMLRHVVNAPGAPAQAWPYTQPTWVFTSRTLPAVDGADI